MFNHIYTLRFVLSGYNIGFTAQKNIMESNAIKPLPKLQQWAKTIKARDCKCMKCGETNDLHAHHIKPKSTHPELTLVIDNGITLCYRCHKKEHETTRASRIRSSNPQKNTIKRKMEEFKLLIENLKIQLGVEKNRSQKITHLQKQLSDAKASMCPHCWLALKKRNEKNFLSRKISH